MEDIFLKKVEEKMSETVSDKYKNIFIENAASIYKNHFNQSIEDVNQLTEKYKSNHFFGEITVYECLDKLANVIDPSDTDLFTVNQLTHSLQVAEMMEKDGLPEEWIMLGLVHDLGKVMLLMDEDPANVVCPNKLIGRKNDLKGLDNLLFSWNHDEYIFLKLGHYFRPELANILRYHSIRYEPCIDLLTESDKTWISDYLLKFRHYDLTSKSLYFHPKKTLKDYKEMINNFFPGKVGF